MFVLKPKNKEQKNWQKKYPNGKAFMSWILDDYQIWQIEPPFCLRKNPNLTEGEQLTEKEIKDWIVDSIQTLKILKETEKKIFDIIYRGFILDIKYLIEIKRVHKDLLDFILDINNFDFY